MCIKEQQSSGGAYLTVYLAMTMAVLLSLCLALIEGARRNGAALEAECITDIGMNSILAEYHRELFSQYNLFAIDTSYGTAMAGKANTERHLRQYLEHNLSMDDIFLESFWYKDFMGLSLRDLELTRVSILTDNKGEVLRKRAVEAIQDDVQLSLLEQLVEWTQVVESRGLEERQIYAEKEAIDKQIQEYNGIQVENEQGEQVTVQMNNPTQMLEEVRGRGILHFVTDSGAFLSGRTIHTENLIAARMAAGNISTGNLNTERSRSGAEAEKEENAAKNSMTALTEDFFFREYLLKYMGSYGAQKDTSALCYQVEYLVAGKENDTENLKSVVNRLLLLRETANAIYLFSDEEKRAEAELLALTLATLMMVPEIAELLEITLLFGWAYAESLYDVRTMLDGGRIPLLKDESTWHYGLQGALQAQSASGGKGETKGLSYEDYLRIFLMLTDTDTLTGRAMDMIEADIRMTFGNEGFRLDECLDGVEAAIFMKSGYGYEFEIVRQKIY